VRQLREEMVSTGQNIARALDRMLYYRMAYALSAATAYPDVKLNKAARFERDKLGHLIDKAMKEIAPTAGAPRRWDGGPR
jgi:hypothetical protein